MRMRIPIIDMMSSVVPVAQRPSTTPMKPKGTLNMMTNGFTKFSNCAAITMYTSMRMRSSSVTRSFIISCWSS